MLGLCFGPHGAADAMNHKVISYSPGCMYFRGLSRQSGSVPYHRMMHDVAYYIHRDLASDRNLHNRIPWFVINGKIYHLLRSIDFIKLNGATSKKCRWRTDIVHFCPNFGRCPKMQITRVSLPSDSDIIWVSDVAILWTTSPHTPWKMYKVAPP